jgi:hypothetical protein
MPYVKIQYMKEMGAPGGNEILHFRYKEKRMSAPVVPDISSLRDTYTSRIVPGLKKASNEAPRDAEVGIGLVRYWYAADDLAATNPETANAIIDALRAAGLHVGEPREPEDHISADRQDLLSNMMIETPEDFYTLDHLSNKTFLIGPMTAQFLAGRWPGTRSSKEEDAAQFHADYSVAIHAETLLAEFPLAENKKIKNSELSEYITEIFNSQPDKK